MVSFVDDVDFTLYVGDAEEVLSGLPDDSVNCVVTSPPYWGLRDYGTGLWAAGDPDCDHAKPPTTYNKGFNERWGQGSGQLKQEKKSEGQYSHTCAKCGASRLDRQIGLEATPDLYVENIVAVFREVRRVLRADGTCWLNLGDTYASQGGPEPAQTKWQIDGASNTQNAGRSRTSGDLKPKNLVGIPWRVAFALQADGWWLRSDIVWAKPNAMPESAKDRPTKAHEYVFMLTKSPRYWFDQEAVRESATWERWSSKQTTPKHTDNGNDRYASFGREWTEEELERYRTSGRNIRSVWEIPTQPYSEAHFATFPEELVRRCLLAGCPEFVCGTCGKPRERLLEKEATGRIRQRATGGLGTEIRRESHGLGAVDGEFQEGVEYTTVGWSDCGHDNWTAGTVLDPFMGSGTTALVARRHGRKAIGVELNQKYAEQTAKRTRQLSLLA